MKNRIKKLSALNMPLWLYIALWVALALLRMAIAYSQRVYLLPQQSGLDDMLMIRAALNLSAGNWLGAYGGVAIAKNMGFALWLALWHALGIPVLLANAALWVAACGFAVWAIRPLLKGNLLRLFAFGLLAFQPVSFAFFTQRVYRDAVFPAFCLLFFAGVLGLALRLGSSKKLGCIVAALVAGTGLAAAWLLREDGVLLLAFAVCGLALILLYTIFSKAVRAKAIKIVCALLPFVVLAGGILGFSAANQAAYGVFLVSDMTSGAFPAAYGAMVGVSQAVSGNTPGTPVTQTALQQLYTEVPSVAALRPSLQEGAAYNGFANLETGEFGGSFYYAVRLAAEYEKLTSTATDAQAYWAAVQTEIEAAVLEGRLPSAGASATTVPRWSGSLLAPTAAESGRGLLEILTFQNCNPRPTFSQGEADSIEMVAAYLHAPVQQGYQEGTEQPYYNTIQTILFLLCDILVWLYRVLIWPLLALALYAFARMLGREAKRLFKHRHASLPLLWCLLFLGLLLSALLRVGVSAYMEAAAFNIGTYIMYYSGALPPLLLFLAAPALLDELPTAAGTPKKVSGKAIKKAPAQKPPHTQDKIVFRKKGEI